MAAIEHILLESSEYAVPTLGTARRLHARYLLHGGARQRAKELTLIDDFYLSVRVARGQSVESQYVVDLRFVDPVPRLRRRVAWRWIAVSAALAAPGTYWARVIDASPEPWWHHEWLPITAALFVVAACALFAAIRLTTETLALLSAHGRAKLVAHTGPVGMLRGLRGFLPRLDAHIRIAAAARRRSLTEHLRDEMREHYRLRNAGALTESEYEAAKRRILARHDSTAAGVPKAKARESPPGPS